MKYAAFICGIIPIALIVAPVSADDVADAALRLKQAAVDKTWKDCKARGIPDARCKGLLSAIHRQEVSIITELQELVGENAHKLNDVRVSAEMASCGGYEYQAMVNCQGRLLDRLRAALNGNTLVSGDQ